MNALETLADVSRPHPGPIASPRSRRHLLYIVTRAEHGGAQSHVIALATGMRRLFDVHVATGEEGFLTERSRELGIHVHVVPHLAREIRPFTDFRGLRELTSLMQRIQPDLVHAHTFKAGFLGRFAAMQLRIPCVYTVHMWPFGRTVPLSWRLTAPVCERLAARWCDRVISVSERGIAVAAQHRICNLSKIALIWNGLPDTCSRAQLTRDADLQCTMVARFTHFKDHAVLLRAFARVSDDVRLVLVGNGDTQDAAKTLARQLGIEARVEFAGLRSDVPEILAQSDIFVLASKQETLPISILEAMRAGLPVIASDVGGVSEEVIDGETGLLVQVGSVEALAAALERLLGDKTLRKSMGRAGRKRFEELFQAERMIERTRALYEQMLEERLAIQ